MADHAQQTSQTSNTVEPQQRRAQPNHLATANPISKLFFSWARPIFKSAYKKKTVVPSDLYECLPEDSSDTLGGRLERNWKKEEENVAKGKRASLTRAMFKTFGFTYCLYGILFMWEEGLRLIQPLLLKWLTEYFSVDSTVSTRDAYLYAMGLGLSALLLAFVHGVNFFGIQRLGMQSRVALCTLMYKKTLKLNNSSLRMTTAGQVNNLMTNDVNRFDQLYVFLHYLWLGPVQAGVVLWLLWLEIDYRSLPGYAIMIFLIPLNVALGKLFTQLRRKTAAFTDQRVAVMTEVITAMRVIKMYAWEKPFGELIKKIRSNEVKKIINASYPLAFNVTLGLFGNRLLDVGMVIFYALTSDTIRTASIFAIVSYCNSLRVSFMRMFPRSIQFRSECLVSLGRIEKYLLLEEKDPEQAARNDEGLARDDGIVAEELTCSWEEDMEMTQLKDVTFTVKKEKLLAVVGPVGAGKSSLLMAVLKELPALSGSIKTQGRIAYASQQPWVFGGTVRDNITFGRDHVERKYRSIIRVCALTTDIKQLPDGDMTMVGERGVTLSGGQKARINLARALYDDADIYLLDDPLSAVDSEVSRHIFEKCIMEYLADKPRILVTHQLQFLSAADQILVLKEGHMEAVGTLSELHEKGVEFSRLMQQPETEDSDSDDEADTSDVPLARVASGSFKRSSSSHRSSTKEKAKTKTSKLFKDEATVKGDITYATYLKYFIAGGNTFSLFWMMLFLFGAQVIYLMADYWLGYWADTEEARANNVPVDNYPIFKNVNLTTEQSAGVYGGLIGGMMFFGIIRAFITFRIMIRAARNLHNLMFASVTRSPVLFFDTTPTGRIQNRFTKDIGIMDDQLPLTFFDFLQISLQIIGTVLITVIISYYTIIAAVPLFIVLIFLTRYALLSTTAIKRLDGTARSPVFSHTTSSLQGLWTIRAYQKEKDFEHQFYNYQDRHSEAWFMYIATNRWFGLRLDLIVVCFTATVAFSCVPLSAVLGAGQVALMLTNCVGLGTIFQFCVRQSALVENQMTSVERVMEYTKLQPEGPLEKPDVKPPPGWPPKGAITFDGLSLAYSKDTPRVLKDISCEIKPKEKIGIVGRTGAGKSSLITALFRLAEPVGGLQLDDVQTTELGLHDIRKKISIIPQDPVIFTGSLRRNLDPFAAYSDVALWSALEDVQLHQAVKENPAKLEMEVGEGGSNFSVGQRQLVCLARAILKKNKVLILDEATANVDPRTDSLIQETIRSKFQNCTVLTIAHRLHTIMDSDRIMVLDAGELIEMDHPYELLRDPKTLFSKLVDQTGKKEAASLFGIAQAHYEKSLSSKKAIMYGPLESQCDYLYVILKRSSEGFGFSLRGEYGSLHTPVVVDEILVGTPADAPGALEVDDEVLALNGKSRRNLSTADIEGAFSMDSSEMSLIVRRGTKKFRKASQTQGGIMDGMSSSYHDNSGSGVRTEESEFLTEPALLNNNLPPESLADEGIELRGDETITSSTEGSNNSQSEEGERSNENDCDSAPAEEEEVAVVNSAGDVSASEADTKL
ncbi:ATP-binding cassette sub-family C member 4-like [Diadema antillarum]|uniref:ATP-binding cassette sub-family C member 4-like n=1 Tax=Diadema antillarum TaxID=105358 RepID=UPI003A872253